VVALLEERVECHLDKIEERRAETTSKMSGQSMITCTPARLHTVVMSITRQTTFLKVLTSTCPFKGQWQQIKQETITDWAHHVGFLP